MLSNSHKVVEAPLGFAWRITEYLDSEQPPSLEISPEISDNESPEKYLEEVAEALIYLGITLLKHKNDSFEDGDEFVESSLKPKSMQSKSEEGYGGYL